MLYEVITLYSLGPEEAPHELPLQKPVISLDLLLLTQADTVFTHPSPAPSVHSGSEIALFLLDRALGRLAANPFEHELHALATAILTR